MASMAPRSMHELNACSAASFASFIEGSVCHSTKFARLLERQRPFTDAEGLLGAARAVWTRECGPTDWLEAVAGHPRLGDRLGAGARKMEGQEQRAVLETMDDRTAATLLGLNEKYEERFGHTFLLCAPGVPAHVVEESMRSRMGNSHTHELMIAASEQMKITEGRMTKLLDLQKATSSSTALAAARVHQIGQHLSPTPKAAAAAPSRTKSQITTHILDVSLGRPASGVAVSLSRCSDADVLLGSGVTDSDGRCTTLLDPAAELTPGPYRLRFETGPYLMGTGSEAFYPEATITFTITQETLQEHFHIPLLLSPYSYSTYRGS